jgi:glucose/arabinose dehydrogenase
MRRLMIPVLVAAALLPHAGARGAATGGGIGAEPVATGLEFPAAFTFAPDGRIFYAEATTGEIRIFDPVTGSDTLFFTLPVDPGGRPALLGLSLAQGYPARPFVYAYAARTVQEVLTNQLVRIRDVGGTGTQPRVIYQSEAGNEHFGTRLLFGADRTLYVYVGDGGDPANAQDLTNTNGKMLRMTASGGVPPDNPFPDSLIWAYGLRNSIGFDFDPQTGFLWEEDNGPECNDELNLLRVGLNYGWGPAATCSTPPPPPRNTNQDGPNPVLPAEYFETPTAPTGLGFCSGCGLTGAEGTMFFGTYNTFEIRQAVLTANRRDVASVSTAYSHSSFILAIEQGPDAALYFSDDTAIYKLVQT